MLKKIKDKLFVSIGILLFILFIFYISYTRPVSLKDMVNPESIAFIDIHGIAGYKNGKHITLKSGNDVGQVIKIFNDYHYSKKIKYKYSNSARVNTSDFSLALTLHYINDHGKFDMINFFIDSNNKVFIDEKEYKLIGKDKKLFSRIQNFFNGSF